MLGVCTRDRMDVVNENETAATLWTFASFLTHNSRDVACLLLKSSPGVLI